MTPSKADVIEVLRRSNPTAPKQSIQMYAQSFVEYLDAESNIVKNGTVCAHPRTGQPMSNPYCAIKSHAMADMGKLLKQLDTNPLWNWWEIQNAPALDEDSKDA